jgi:outer membrane protein assembly factor BamB
MGPTNSPSPPRRAWLRVWFPVVVLGGAVFAVAGIWAWPAEDVERAARTLPTVAVGLLSVCLLALWLVCFSALRGWRAVCLLLLAALAATGAVRDIKLTGDWIPLFIFRWDAAAGAALAAPPVAAAADGLPLLAPRLTDYPGYRGRNRDGVIFGPPLARDWQARPPRLLWRRPVGGGYSSSAVVGAALVTLEQRGNREAVVCYDAATGAERWAYEYPAHFSEWQGGAGPRATPTVADGDVYSLGATGQLVCLSGGDGKLKWAVNVLEANDNLRWGMSGSPLVFDNVVVVNAGVQKQSAAGRALVAYDRASGKQVWSAGATRAGYSSPMLATLAGQRQIVLFDGEQVAGYEPEGGGLLWSYPWTIMQGINVAQPLVLDRDRVFISSGYGVGCALLQVSKADQGWSVKPLWGKPPNRRMQCKFTSPVARDGYIYGLDNGVLVCLDQKDGSRRWKGERYGHGQLLLADDLLVILAESGELALVAADPQAPRELGKVAALTAKTRTWNYPALADGRAYVRNDLEMACFDLRADGKDPEPAPGPR